MFQFQTGAIKSSQAPDSRSKGAKSFNSKLVRLKVEGYVNNPQPQLRFNSKLVRLKVSDANETFLGARGGFNSKLVRLKEADVDRALAGAKRFNSKLVRLKVLS